MISGENRLAVRGDQEKSYFFAIPFFVVFFGVCIIFQIALIKLVGGFFYAKQTRDVLMVDRGIKASANYWNVVLPLPALSGNFESQTIDLPSVCGLFFSLFFLALILVIRDQFIPLSLYESDHIRIRPPITFLSFTFDW